MGVNLRVESEFGKVIEELPDPTMIVSHLLLKTDLSGTTCVKFIDAYGNTTFNYLQIPVLIDELKQILMGVEDSDTKDHVRRIIQIAERTRDQHHVYLKFVGD